MCLSQVHAAINKQTAEGIKIIKRLINQRSTSTDACGIRECALLLKNIMSGLGIKAYLIETEGNPVVYGEVLSNEPDAPTLVLYNHYDVQPIGAETDWTTPPFSATEKDGRIYGRGAGDNKGQLAANLFGVSEYLRVNGQVPVNIKFIIEGEEEIGCPSFKRFLKNNKDLLKGDIVIICDSSIHSSGAPYMIYGVRGSLKLSLRSVTANTDHHSGNKGGVIPEAAWELVQVLASMYDKNYNVTIDGFYDGIIEPNNKELQWIDSIPYDPDELTAAYELAKPLSLSRREYYYRLMFRPTLSILGIKSGLVQNGGIPGAIPGSAQAILNIRFPYPQTVDHLFRAVEKHVKNINPGIEVIFHSSSPAARTKTDLPILNTIESALENAFGKKVIHLPSMGASWASFCLWEQVMNMPAVIIPYANIDENNHSPNENISINCFITGAHAIAEIIYALGNA
ncbi:MAG TPA: M20/M25/M40 family metallo-hydrolase [Clostridiales bacterium]|nr:M20/M25/M40 family metallo-hydrolase [Clostridiales bacterium]